MYDIENPATLTYITLIQNNITRMATNSSNCKAICVALLTALSAVSGLTGGAFFISGFLPVVILCYLDIKYLALEKQYRDKYNAVIKAAKDNELAKETLFDMNPGYYHSNGLSWASFCSWSVRPVYLTMIAILALMAFVKQ